MTDSKTNGKMGDSTTLEELERRLRMRKEEEEGREKQRRPLDTERRRDVNEAVEEGRDNMRQWACVES